MTDSDFTMLSNYIKEQSGIYLPPEKKLFLSSRLHQRLNELNLTTYSQYLEFLLNHGHEVIEKRKLINRICINKTEFFRDSIQFEFLSRLIPEITEGFLPGRQFRIWSAGCSTGEEAYSLAMLILERNLNLRTDIKVFGTDISTDALKSARKGIYNASKFESVPDVMQQRFFLKGKGKYAGQLKISKELSRLVDFYYHNLVSDDCRKCKSLNIIFCRNVLIYFNTATVKRVITKLLNSLSPGGYIFFGGTESFSFMPEGMEMVGPNIFKKMM